MPITLEEAWKKMDNAVRKMLDFVSTGNKEGIIAAYRSWQSIYEILTPFEQELWLKTNEHAADIVMTVAEKLPMPSYIKIKTVSPTTKEELWGRYGGNLVAHSGENKSMVSKPYRRGY